MGRLNKRRGPILLCLKGVLLEEGEKGLIEEGE